MKISYNWLKDFFKIDFPSEKVAQTLTDLGLEVESVETFQSIKGGLKGVVVGHILECEKHPDADKLSITKVDLGDNNPVQIVCGAPNVAKGQKVAVATIGTILYAENGEPIKIKKGKIRGAESYGMICAEDELGLGKSQAGIMVLDENIPAGTPCSEVFFVETDEVFEIGLTPNRADAMSHFGVARDLRAGFLQQDIQREFITPSVNDFFVDNRSFKIDVQVENKELVPRYCGVTISNIKVGDSPLWLQNRLKAIGISPKNNVVDATNYVLHDLGQPLHAFDAHKILDKKIIVRQANEGEKIEILDGTTKILSKEDIVIADSQKALCVAGVMGGKNSAVSETTTHIFLESAYFAPVSVRKTSKKIGINSDSSFRFERGIDIANCKYALLRVAALIKKIAGGEISSEVIDFYPKKQEDFQVFLTFDKINSLLGNQIPQNTIKSILRSLDIQINSATERGLGLSVPSYRVDVQREVDVIEEILRVYGYNNISFPEKMQISAVNSPKIEDFKIENIVANQLVSQGFFEIMSNSLVPSSYSNILNEEKSSTKVDILNPLSQDLSSMRENLLFSCLEAVSYNIKHKRSDLQLFEVGKSYHKIKNEYKEIKQLSLCVTGNKSEELWQNKAQKTDFFVLKSNILGIFERFNLNNFSQVFSENQYFSEGIDFYIADKKIAELGVVKKSVLKHFDIKQEVIFGTILWDNLLSEIAEKPAYKAVAKFPEVRRDLALLLDESILFKDIYKTAFNVEKKLLKKVSLFDVYQGDKLPENKKSYALSFILQDETKTLTDNQIEKVMQNLLYKFKTEFKAELR